MSEKTDQSDLRRVLEAVGSLHRQTTERDLVRWLGLTRKRVSVALAVLVAQGKVSEKYQSASGQFIYWDPTAKSQT